MSEDGIKKYYTEVFDKLHGNKRTIVTTEELGKGANAVVYAGARETGEEDQAEQIEPVAVKFLKAEHMGDRQTEENLRREGEILRNFSQHPNILTIKDIVFDQNRGIGLITEKLEGENAYQMLDELKGKTRLVGNVLEAIGSALGVLHRTGWVFRDVKAENIFLERVEDDSGLYLRPKLIDFGALINTATLRRKKPAEKGQKIYEPGDDEFQDRSLIEHPRQTVDGKGAGTPVTMSPEQADRNKDHLIASQSDLYGLAVTAYEMLTGGKNPFFGDDDGLPVSSYIKAHVSHDVIGIDTFVQPQNDYDRNIQQIIMDLLRKDIALRGQIVLVDGPLAGEHFDIKNGADLHDILSKLREAYGYEGPDNRGFVRQTGGAQLASGFKPKEATRPVSDEDSGLKDRLLRRSTPKARADQNQSDEKFYTEQFDKLHGPLKVTVTDKLLGSGGYANVYAGYRESSDPDDPQEEVAIKFLGDFFQRDPGFVERLRREIETLKAVSSHPNIVTIKDAILDPERGLGIVMEKLDGVSGDKLMIERIAELRGDTLFVCRVMQSVASALGELHRLGIVDRDVKPANIFFKRKVKNGRELLKPQLLDFGLVAKMTNLKNNKEKNFQKARQRLQEAGAEDYRDRQDVRMTVDGSTAGTSIYMSPEQVLSLDEKVSPLSDLYGLAVSMYQMYTGRDIFPDHIYDSPDKIGMAHAVHKPVEISSDVRAKNDFDRNFQEIIMTLLKKDLASRSRISFTCGPFKGKTFVVKNGTDLHDLLLKLRAAYYKVNKGESEYLSYLDEDHLEEKK